MSKTLVAGLQAYLDTKSTTMALCWKIVRRDGVVQGFTEHDEDMVFDGVTYLASSGFTSSRMEQNLGMAPSNLNVDGALSSATINEDDLAKGRYDNADVSLYWVNWNNVAQRVTLEIGNIGEIARRETFFSAEFRSLAHRLNQKTGRVYQRSCDAVLGDTRCGVDLTSPSYKGTGAITSATGRNLVVSGIGAFADKFFTYGVLTFTSGVLNFVNGVSGLSTAVSENVTGLSIGLTYRFIAVLRNVSGPGVTIQVRTSSGGGGTWLAVSSTVSSTTFVEVSFDWVCTQSSIFLSVLGALGSEFEVQSVSFKELSANVPELATLTNFDKRPGTEGTVTFASALNNGLAFEVKSHIGTAIVLWDIPPETVAGADGFTITAGCPKDAETCRTKFNNIVNFRGFPFIPGNDILPSYPREEDETLDGGSYFR